MIAETPLPHIMLPPPEVLALEHRPSPLSPVDEVRRAAAVAAAEFRLWLSTAMHCPSVAMIEACAELEDAVAADWRGDLENYDLSDDAAAILKAGQ